MSAPPLLPPESGDAIGRLLGRVTRALAVAGGVLLLAMTFVTVASVAGRTLFARPVPGDFELVELGAAVAVFAFLPYCQLRGGNVIVDFFTVKAGRRARVLMDAFGALLYAAIAALLAWRLALGGLDMHAVGEETMVLAVPVWWAFLPIVVSAGLLVAVCLYTVWRSLGGLGR